MMVYVNDDGYLMEDTDFIPYVIWLITQVRSENGDWGAVLSSDFWGEQLLCPQILIDIKELIK